MPHIQLRLATFALSLLTIASISGCDNTSTLSFIKSQARTIVKMEGTPYFILNTPKNKAYWDHFSNITEDQIKERASNGDGEAAFLLGLVYFGQITGFERQLDTSEGSKLLQEAWRLGVIDAGYSLFTVYYKGIGTQVNKPLALAYLQASAEKGYILSQKDLGHAYRGADPRDLVNEDIQQAKIWFTEAAEQGDAESATQLAGIYREGTGVPKDEQTAFEWLKRAEDMPFNGFLSHRGLANYYEHGIGTEVDLVQAYKYYDLQDPAGAPDKRRLEAIMTLEQVQEAIRLSREWQEEHGVFVPSYYGLEYQPDGSFK